MSELVSLEKHQMVEKVAADIRRLYRLHYSKLLQLLCRPDVGQHENLRCVVGSAADYDLFVCSKVTAVSHFDTSHNLLSITIGMQYDWTDCHVSQDMDARYIICFARGLAALIMPVFYPRAQSKRVSIMELGIFWVSSLVECVMERIAQGIVPASHRSNIHGPFKPMMFRVHLQVMIVFIAVEIRYQAFIAPARVRHLLTHRS